MISHLIKMLWNRRRSNFLVLLEIFISFVVLVAVINVMLLFVGEYLKSSGYSHRHKNVLLYQLSWEETPDEEAKETLTRVKKNIQAMPEVAEVSLTRNTVPYVDDNSGDWVEIKYKEQTYGSRKWLVDDQFQKVLNMPLVDGHWFSSKHNASKLMPIVINNDLKEEVFGGKNAVGEVIKVGEKDRVVVGVVANSYSGGLAKPLLGYFERNNMEEVAAQPAGYFLVRFKSPITVETYSKMDKLITQVGLSEQWTNSQTGALELYRSYWFRELIIPVILITFIAGFIFMNVVMGLYGVFWQSISRRRSEIGVRRAVGALTGSIYRQMIGEVLLLATLAMIPGFVIVFQFFIFNTFDFIDSRIYLVVMLFSAGVIYILVTICALYPSWLAANIQPAEALHEE